VGTGVSQERTTQRHFGEDWGLEKHGARGGGNTRSFGQGLIAGEHLSEGMAGRERVRKEGSFATVPGSAGEGKGRGAGTEGKGESKTSRMIGLKAASGPMQRGRARGGGGEGVAVTAAAASRGDRGSRGVWRGSGGSVREGGRGRGEHHSSCGGRGRGV
jgi:hypothetical protein